MRVVSCGISFLAAALLAVVGGAAPAEAVSAQVRKACAGDYKRLCPGYKIGSPQLRACMWAKQSSITPGCVQALIDSGEVNRSATRR